MEETTKQPESSKVQNLISNSVTLKLIIITVLMLLLLIPTTMIESIMQERERLSKQVVTEVSNEWGGTQQINGPILVIPLLYEYQQNEKTTSEIKYLYVLPETLNINGNIQPKKLRRGIYQVVVYKSDVLIKGDFVLKQEIDQRNLKEIQYDQAFITIGISDLRGIRKQIKFKWGKEILGVSSGSKITGIIKNGITVNLPNVKNTLDKAMPFEFSLNLFGSKKMSFVPVGSVTDVKLTSSWSSPKFNGNFLPTNREVNQQGFSANWKVLKLNRNFPQSWIGGKASQKISENTAFGVDLILPLDDYQKSMRSVKYAAMTIALTFLVFFLVEVLNKRKIHPLQYALVGLALCLFYALLVSISEHSNFNFAYGVSTMGIVTMISFYSLSVFKIKRLTLILISTLFGIYGFLFVTLQLADYALLMGSLGLTLILGATMYFTRNINWYNLGLDLDEK